MHDQDNDGRFPDDSPVEVRYPASKKEEHGDRERWPWLPGTILGQCGPDEWRVCVEVRDLAVLRDGRRAPRGTASRNLYFRCCLRDSSEIWPRPASGGPAAARGVISERPVVVDLGHPSWAEVDAEQRERLGQEPGEDGRP